MDFWDTVKTGAKWGFWLGIVFAVVMCFLLLINGSSTFQDLLLTAVSIMLVMWICGGAIGGLIALVYSSVTKILEFTNWAINFIAGGSLIGSLWKTV